MHTGALGWHWYGNSRRCVRRAQCRRVFGTCDTVRAARAPTVQCGVCSAQQRRQLDAHGYANASQLLTRLRRVCTPTLLVDAICKYDEHFEHAMHFAYVMHRHLIPIAQLCPYDVQLMEQVRYIAATPSHNT
jgi:hypothetical protein